jgi:Methyltransferase domain
MRPFSFEEAVEVLVSRGIDDHTVRLGSIPESALTLARDAIAEHCPRRPLRVLHVGNYLGISLAAISDIVVRHDPGSVVVSIDPNLKHHGVEDPQRHVLALLDHFGLQRNSVVVCGYSLQRAANETRVGTFADHPACEDTLRSFERLGVRFDLALIDGNHGQDYVRGELARLRGLLSDRAVLILEDVFDDRTALQSCSTQLMADDSWPLELVASDDHVAVLVSAISSPAAV